MRLFVALFLLLGCFNALAVGMTTRFEHLGLKDGLSQSLVYSTVQDDKGFLWFGTQDGLNRYDGNTFKVFRHDIQNPHSISGNWIESLYVDSKKRLWIGLLGGGLNRFDAQTERFIRYEYESANSHSISNSQIQTIVEDKHGRLWLGTKDGGLILFDESTHQFTLFEHQPNDRNSISDNGVTSLLIDARGDLWVGTGGGLDYISIGHRSDAFTFEHFRHKAVAFNSLSDNRVLSLFEDNQGKIWIGTNNGLNRIDPLKTSAGITRFPQFGQNPVLALYQDSRDILWIGTESYGLIEYDMKQELYFRIVRQAGEPDSLSDHTIRSIFEDKQGILWIGTETGGINKLDWQKQRFNHFRAHASEGSLSDNSVTAFYVDSSNTLWVGTGNGLNRFDDKTKRFTHFKHQVNNPYSISSDRVRTIVEDEDGTLWVGTFDGGLNKFDSNTEQFTRFRHNPDKPNSSSHLADDKVSTLFIDSKNRFWIGSVASGLSLFEPKTEQFTHFGSKTNGIYTIAQDIEGMLWLGNRDGLQQFNPNTQQVVTYRHQPSDQSSLSDDSLGDIYVAEDGSLWIGTANGLNRFNPKSKSFTRYTTSNGLPNNFIYGIAEDNNGHLWLSTNKGISRFDRKRVTFSNFDVNDGLQSDEFNGNAVYKSPAGELFFGGIDGFNRFYGEQIVDDKQLPTVVLTDFLLANQQVTIDPDKANIKDKAFFLSKSINELTELTLTYQQNLVSFEFAALHFANPNKNQYAYKLEGFDNDWIKTDAKKRWATYTRLPAGQYTLRLKASNHLGYWNSQEKTLAINVQPPPWQSWWAYLIYMGLGALFIGSLFHAQRKKVLYERQKVLDERAVVQRLTEVDKLKDDFLANTSHELRTPLNGIIGLAESLLDGVAGPLPDNANHNLAMVVASGRRLANLVNDILDFSTLKNRSLTLNLRPVDLHSMVTVVCDLSRPLVGEKSLKLVNNISEQLPAVKADENRLQQILHNLVGNAIKFTEQGEVTIAAQVIEAGVKVSVSDSGIGIAPERIKVIFDSFEQLEGHISRNYGGTGLGLSVSKQLVELHGGTIEVSSKLGEGSTFSFVLPLSDKPAIPLTAMDTQRRLSSLNYFDVLPVADNVMAEYAADGECTLDGRQFRILVVDDEPINLQVINNHLSLHDYHLTQAQGGEQALAALENDEPFDLVLLDIMMPKVSGYDVCQQLRKKWSVNDLPVIFLTAKNQVDDLVQSFALGGNDYLTKPVTKHELLSRVKVQLQMLDTNRNLELKVQQRTGELQQSLTQLKAAQQKLIESEKMAALGNMVAGVAHEVNTPLGICITMVSLHLEKLQGFAEQIDQGKVTRKLMDNYLADTKQSQTLVQGNLHKAATLVDDFKKVAVEQQDINAEQVNFEALINDTIAVVEPRLNEQQVQLSLNVQAGSELQKLQTFPEAWSQIIFHLIDNSLCHGFVDAVGVDGVNVKSAKSDAKIVISCQVNANAVMFIYQDNGRGMDEQQQQKVFEPFYTTKRNQGGTGLGMHLVYNLVTHKLSGNIGCTSAKGDGVKFVIEVPIG